MRRPVHPTSTKAAPKAATKKAITRVVPDRSLERIVENLSHQATALQMSAEGYSNRDIADEMLIPLHQVPALLAAGLAEYLEERNVAAEKVFGIMRRRYDLMIQKWMPKALGYVEKVVNADGAIVEVTHKPDPEAARIINTIQRDAAKMFGFNKLRVEHTGAHGGPIMSANINIDWSRATDEQLAQIKAGNADVIRQLSGPDSSGGSTRG